MPRFAFFGTPELACEILDALEAAGYVPSLIVSMPDRPQGRGMAVRPAPVAARGERRGIEVLKFERLDAAATNAIAERGAQFAIVVAYGLIVPPPLIDAFPRGMWNIHYSLLPRWRGATPVESAILAGDEETGVAIQRMVYALDEGPLAAVERVRIRENETAPALRKRLNAIAANLLNGAFSSIASGSVQLYEQDGPATRCGKITKADGDITHDDDLTRWRKYRAYYAWPGTYFFAHKAGKVVRVKVVLAHLERGRFVMDSLTPEGKPPMTQAHYQQWLS